MKKNLLIVSDDFCLESGGVENTSYLFAEFFSKHMKVTTLSPSSGHDINIEGVSVIKGRFAQKNPLYLFDSIIKVFGSHRKHHYDFLLAVHYAFAPCCLFLKLFRGVPYGVLTHGEEVIKWKKGGFFSTIKYALYFPVRYLVLKNANMIFSNTSYTKELVKKVTSNKEIFVINPPIGFMPDYNKISSSKAHVMISIGRLAERKGFQNAIKALPIVHKRIADLKYIIAGSGEKEAYLKDLVKEYGLENAVIFKGRISEEEKVSLLKECGLFVMPSYSIPNNTIEGFGLSLLEANSYGRFVVSSWSGGIPEAVLDGKTGFLVHENDVDDLASAIIRFYDKDFEYDPYICADWARKRYIAEIVEQYLKYINKVIK